MKEAHRFDSRQEQESFLFSTANKSAQGTTQSINGH